MKKLIILLFVSLFVFGCNKNEETLPSDNIYCNITSAQYNFTKTSDARYIIGENQDQVMIIMIDESKNLLCNINITSTDLLQAEFPKKIGQNLIDGETGDVQIINMNMPVDTLFGKGDDVNYSGWTFSNDEFEMVIESFENGLMTGTFKGLIETKTGKTEFVAEGEFIVNLSFE